MWRFLRKLRPFKGLWFWEIQVGPLVIQWQHAENRPKGQLHHDHWYQRLHVWHDHFWLN
jgi:hypothetical protein